MSFDLERIWESKRKYRRYLASQPIAEKLAMLDALRERTMAIRGAARNSSAAGHNTLRESPGGYGSGSNQ